MTVEIASAGGRWAVGTGTGTSRPKPATAETGKPSSTNGSRYWVSIALSHLSSDDVRWIGRERGARNTTVGHRGVRSGDLRSRSGSTAP